jgi:hypothetical protein
MKRLVKAAETQTMTMVKQNEAIRRKQSTIPRKTKTNLTAMVATYFVMEGSR